RRTAGSCRPREARTRGKYGSGGRDAASGAKTARRRTRTSGGADETVGMKGSPVTLEFDNREDPAIARRGPRGAGRGKGDSRRQQNRGSRRPACMGGSRRGEGNCTMRTERKTR